MAISVNIILNKRPNRNGLHPLQLKITSNGRSIRPNIGKTIKKEYWNSIEKKVNLKHPYSKRFNNHIQNKIIEVNKLILELEEKNMEFSLDDLKQLLIEKKVLPYNQKSKSRKSSSISIKKKCTVFELFNEHLKNLKESKDYYAYSNGRTPINHFKKYSNHKDLHFADLTIVCLEGFRAYLKGKGSISDRSIANYMIEIRTIYNKAISAGIIGIENYPFGKNKISCKRPDSEKIGLDSWEVKLLEEVNLDDNKFLHHARNVWLFSFYFAGLRAGDTLCLKRSSILNDRLYYTMQKNSKPGSVKITPKARAILNQYISDKASPHNLVFPDLFNVINFNDKTEVQKKLKYRIRKLNRALRKIAEIVGIEKDITMHISRHSFGNIAGDKIPLQRLQQLYRHSSIVTTVNYQKAFLKKGADEALEKVLNF